MRNLFIIIMLLFAWACKPRASANSVSDIYYTCSMDPQVVESAPGKCPICKMDLTPVKKNSAENSDELAISDQQLLLGNIKIDTIRQGRLGDKLVLTATLNFDQMQASSVSSRVMGRVERLYVKNPGDLVRSGMPLYDLYSEELNNAKQEYLLAIEKRKAFSGESTIPFEELVLGARNKLKLWGLQEAQIRELEQKGKATPITTFFSPASGYITSLELKEGDYVMEGGTVVKLANLSSLWAEAQVYTSQLAGINPQSQALVELPDLDGRTIPGRIEFVNPEINPDTRINLVRVAIPNQDLALRPGMPAYVILNSPKRDILSLPIDAVIRDARGATVWIRSAGNIFKPVSVKTGAELDDRIEIKSGLQEGDAVVISGAYLLHSEYVFRKGAEPSAAHQH